jgi:hypothetical protein
MMDVAQTRHDRPAASHPTTKITIYGWRINDFSIPSATYRTCLDYAGVNGLEALDCSECSTGTPWTSVTNRADMRAVNKAHTCSMACAGSGDATDESRLIRDTLG